MEPFGPTEGKISGDRSEPRLVVLLHGLGRTSRSMAPLGRYLARSGWRVINVGYPSLRHDIDAHAERLHRSLVSAELADTELNFVTHSLGGIVVRAFLRRFGEGYRFGRAVMLGPPNQGSSFAHALQKSIPLLSYVMGPSYREVSTVRLPAGTDRLTVGIIAGSRTLARGYSPFVSGPNDGIVAVAETALAGAADTLVVTGLHTFLMHQPAVQRQVAFFLDNGRFDRKAEAS